MSGPEHIIPFERLPEGFAERVGQIPENPVAPRPAATIALLRRGRPGLEVLLLRRRRVMGFVPGAYVFPGGRVDADDAAPSLLERLVGLDRESAAARLGLGEGDREADPPAVAYYVAAIREAFEETGILLGRAPSGEPAPSIAEDPELLPLRQRLLENDGLFPEVLDRLGCVMDGGGVEYIAHWITPRAEPRRYDTRFFAAAVPDDAGAAPHRGEMTHAVWITPERALERHLEGTLPMVFPTIKTIEALRDFREPADALAHHRTRTITSIEPRLVRTPTGIGLEVDDETGV